MKTIPALFHAIPIFCAFSFQTMSFALSASCLLAMNRNSSFSKEEKDSLMDILFLASCYLKIQSTDSELSSDEIEKLKKFRSSAKVMIETIQDSPVSLTTELVSAVATPVATPTTVPTPESTPTPAATPTASPVVTPTAAPAATTVPTAAPVVTPTVILTAQAFRCTTINEAKCRARKYGAHIPDTKPKACYEEQCKNKPEAGKTLCKKCGEYQDWVLNPDQFKTSTEKAKKRRYWLGTINGEIPDHVTIVGGKWFEKNFPNGIPSSTAVEEATAENQTESEEIGEESVAEETVPVQTEQWKLHIHGGITYVVNTKNNKIYKADMTKQTTKDMVIMEEFVGLFENGVINQYVEEADIDE